MGAVVLRLGLLNFCISILCFLAIHKTPPASGQWDVFTESFSPLGPSCPDGTVAGTGGILDVVGLTDNWEHAVREG